MSEPSEVIAFIATLGRDLSRLERAVHSVLQWGYPNLTLVIVDNSEDRVVAATEDFDVISTGINLGFVGAFEIVASDYHGDFIWSLQDDMVLLNDCLTPMIKRMHRNKDIGAITPVLDHDGVQPAHMRAGFFRDAKPGEPPWVAFPGRDTPLNELNVAQDFGFVFSSGTLYRSAALSDVGGIDVGLWPLQHVDVDIGMRLSQRGWRSVICLEARAWHAKSQSTPAALGRILSHLNESRILLGPGSTPETDLLSFGRWSPMVARMSHLAIELGIRLNHREDELRTAEEELRRVKNSVFWKVMGPARKVTYTLRDWALSLFGRSFRE